MAVEIRGGTARCGEMRGDMGRYGEIWGGTLAAETRPLLKAATSSRMKPALGELGLGFGLVLVLGLGFRVRVRV